MIQIARHISSKSGKCYQILLSCWGNYNCRTHMNLSLIFWYLGCEAHVSILECFQILLFTAWFHYNRAICLLSPKHSQNISCYGKISFASPMSQTLSIVVLYAIQCILQCILSYRIALQVLQLRPHLDLSRMLQVTRHIKLLNIKCKFRYLQMFLRCITVLGSQALCWLQKREWIYPCLRGSHNDL